MDYIITQAVAYLVLLTFILQGIIIGCMENDFGYSYAKVTDVSSVTKGNGETGTSVSYQITSTSQEAEENAIEIIGHLAERAGASMQVRDPDGKVSKNFSVGKKNWNAPWQPTGPTPPWSLRPREN